ncbi:hypothetical protein GCM10027285_20810 [Oleiagrimonas citrea]|uniref:Uncharacterized protein n=1 Tax=Oleiagrimonas citrea TaxID=1665687 RepID=A0A846ZJ39_9GAMM|nr:hypothetical protein [Oleiagrimonas citrea]NKZ37603.1 hypothetical protein [Oleiagrimonas citrea]
MSASYSTNYSVKEIQSSSDHAFASAISIYADHVPPDLRTNTGEITHWLDHYNQTFEDRLHILSLSVNKNVAGFCELVHLKETNIVVIDYIAIDRRYRGGLEVFFNFATLVRSFILERYPTVSYVVVEIAPLKENEEIRYGLPLLRLVKMMGFGVIDATYIQPSLGNNNSESELEGALLINPKPTAGVLPKQSYLRIVRSIYYDHYVRWYGYHGKDYEHVYKSNTDRLYAEVAQHVKKERIVVNGLRHFPEDRPNEPTAVVAPPTKVLWPAIGMILFCLLVLLCMKALFKVSFVWIIAALIAAMILYFALSSMVDKRASPVLRELIKAFKSSFGKVK